GRRYLPARELRLFGCSPEEPRQSAGFAEAMRFQVERARSYYRAGMGGVAYIPPRSRFAIRLAAGLYEAILDKIAQQNYDVFARRAHTSRREKLLLALRLQFSGDAQPAPPWSREAK
ncbi:MAG: phytoene/squalene synthase family protein, partial [Chloroflexota bacterium]